MSRRRSASVSSRPPQRPSPVRTASSTSLHDLEELSESRRFKSSPNFSNFPSQQDGGTFEVGSQEDVFDGGGGHKLIVAEEESQVEIESFVLHMSAPVRSKNEAQALVITPCIRRTPPKSRSISSLSDTFSGDEGADRIVILAGSSCRNVEPPPINLAVQAHPAPALVPAPAPVPTPAPAVPLSNPVAETVTTSTNSEVVCGMVSGMRRL